MNRRQVFLLLRILCGGALLWWAWRQVGLPAGQVLSNLTLDWRWLPLGVLLGGLAVLGWALRWHLFQRMCGLSTPFTETLRLTLFADFFNLYFLGPLGADGIRVLFLLRQFPEKKVRILASIILDHASGLMGGALLYALFTRPQSAWVLEHGSLVPGAALVVADVLLGGVALATAAAAVVICEPVVWRFITHRLKLGFTLRPLEPFRFLQGQRLGLTLAHVISAPLLLATYLTYWTAGMAAHQSPSVTHVLAVMPLVDVVCGMPITVSGLGLRESVFIGLLGPDLPQGNQGALITSLLGFALTGVWGLFGGIWLFLHRWQRGSLAAPTAVS